MIVVTIMTSLPYCLAPAKCTLKYSYSGHRLFLGKLKALSGHDIRNCRTLDGRVWSAWSHPYETLEGLCHKTAGDMPSLVVA